MEIMIYAMFAIILALIIFAVVMLAKQKDVPADAEKYDVFVVSGNQLTVLAGISVTYDIDAIEKITFSARTRRGRSYVGIMRIVKTNGRKSRPFLFDGSAYSKKTVWVNSKSDIENSILYLTDKLKSYGIRALRLP